MSCLEAESVSNGFASEYVNETARPNIKAGGDGLYSGLESVPSWGEGVVPE